MKDLHFDSFKNPHNHFFGRIGLSKKSIFRTALFLSGILVNPISAEAQTPVVTHGPIIGGVSPNTARAFIRTSDATAFTIEISSDQFQNVDITVNDNSQAANDFSEIVDISGLQANTRYWVRTSISGTPSGPVSSFKTFPSEGQSGHYKFLFGSCIYELSDTDSSLFVQMATEDANIFTPTGDWGYPDKDSGAEDVYLTNPPTSWAVDYNNVRAIYKERYAPASNGASYYRSTVIDYTYDDHDYLNDNSGSNFAATFDINPFGSNFGEPNTTSQPPQARLNCIRGYQELFPGYNLIDSTEGIFHSYTMGNCEFFVLDTRSARSPQHDAIKEVGGEWVLQEPPGHSILGQTQMNWLLNGLQNSTADWKFLISSVTFNKGYQAVIDSLLSIGKSNSPIFGVDVGGFQISTGLIGAGIMSDMWVGFPTDQDALLDHIRNHNIRNVFIISGDAHSAALDDGTNAGLPELMAANLKKANSEDALILSNFIGYSLWNLGASGMGNQNFNNTYGKVEVFERDSVRLSAVDASGVEVVGHTFVYDSVGYTNIPSPAISGKKLFKIFPNPARQQLFIEAIEASGEDFEAVLIDASGKQVFVSTFKNKMAVNLKNLAPGYYLYAVSNGKGSILASGKVQVTD